MKLTDKFFQERLASLYHNVINGLYDNSREAFYIQYGKVLGLLELIPIEDMRLRLIEESDCKFVYEVWEERYNIRHIKSNKDKVEALNLYGIFFNDKEDK